MTDETAGPDELVLLGVIDLVEGKRLKNLLAETRKIRIELLSNPETCSTGSCGAKVELYCRQADVEAFQEVVRAERANLMEGLEVPEHATAVFDSEAAQATCPACGATFATSCAECPDCGLGFAVE